MSAKTGKLTAVDVEPAERLARSFKAAMAAVRRLRGRETHRTGELSDAHQRAADGLRPTRARRAYCALL